MMTKKDCDGKIIFFYGTKEKSTSRKTCARLRIKDCNKNYLSAFLNQSSLFSTINLRSKKKFLAIRLAPFSIIKFRIKFEKYVFDFTFIDIFYPVLLFCFLLRD